MSPGAVTFRLISEIRKSESRSIGFLRGHRELDAEDVFLRLDDNQRRHLLFSMDLWVSGANGPPGRFHPFRHGEAYRMCFAFRSLDDRFYGFLCHPEPNFNPRLQTCVLCIHASKNERQTDVAELIRIRRWSASTEAKSAIRVIYQDKAKAAKKGKIIQWRK